jgi:hypothetical protein
MSSVRDGFPGVQRIRSNCHFGCSVNHCSANCCPRNAQLARPDQPFSTSGLIVWQWLGCPNKQKTSDKVTSIMGSAKGDSPPNIKSRL